MSIGKKIVLNHFLIVAAPLFLAIVFYFIFGGINLLFFEIGLALLLLTVISSLISARRISNTLVALTRIAKKIATNDAEKLDQLTSYENRRDEIGDLAKAFKQMVEVVKSGRKNLEQKVEERTRDLQKFKLAVDNASDQIVITDPEGLVVYANRATEQITGYPIKEVVGKKAGKLWGGRMPKSFYSKMWDRIKKQKRDFDGSVTNKRKNGELYEAAINVAPVVNDKGKVLFFVGLERDITEEKKIDRAKTEFVSLVSHQLRTPLTGIKWALELLLDKHRNLNAEQIAHLNEIDACNEKMIALINALLNISRIELGTVAMNVKPTDVEKILDDEIKGAKKMIAEKKLTVNKKYDPAAPKINCDEKLLRIIFSNLLSNAVKYTPVGGRITLTISREPKGIEFCLADTGYGIPQRQQHLIFTKLFRGDNIKLKTPDGTGLGLYMVKKIIELMRGKIWFESIENQGSKFCCFIPQRGPRRPPAGLELIK